MEKSYSWPITRHIIRIFLYELSFIIPLEIIPVRTLGRIDNPHFITYANDELRMKFDSFDIHKNIILYKAV